MPAVISSVDALNYRCLRYVARSLKPFQVLVGPNASGKTTFLDVIGFLSDVVSKGLDHALTDRAPDARDLLFRGCGTGLELAIEAAVPDHLREQSMAPDWNAVRYQVAVGFDDTDRQFELKAETLMLLHTDMRATKELDVFPWPPTPPESLQKTIGSDDRKVLINKVQGGTDNFYDETKPSNRSSS